MTKAQKDFLKFEYKQQLKINKEAESALDNMDCEGEDTTELDCDLARSAGYMDGLDIACTILTGKSIIKLIK